MIASRTGNRGRDSSRSRRSSHRPRRTRGPGTWLAACCAPPGRRCLLMHLSKTICPDDERFDALSSARSNARPRSASLRTSRSSAWSPKRAGRRLCLFPLGRHSRIAHVVKHRNPREIRDQLFEKLDPLRRQLGTEGRHPRDIAARSREARDNRTRVAHRRHDDWNCFGRVFGRSCSRRPPCHDQIELEAHQLGREVGNRSARPSADRYSIIRFRPST